VGALLDGDQHLAKAFSLTSLLAGGDLFPRWSPDFYGGYGYPTFTFYAPATYYALAGLGALLPGGGLYTAFQLLGALAALAVVGGTYALAWRLWGHAPAAVLACAGVAYAPYLLQTNLFVRGAVPEVAGLAELVWLWWAVTGLWMALAPGDGAGPSPAGGRRWGAVVLLVAGLLLTHNILAALGAFLVGAWVGCLLLWRPAGRPLLWLAGAAGLGALATAFFWLPAVLETPLVQVEAMYRGNLHYRNWFLTWPGVHAALWGLPERSPWTPGWPVDLHLVYRHALYGAPKVSLWQAVSLVLSLLAGGLWLGRRRWAGPGRADSAGRRGAEGQVAGAPAGAAGPGARPPAGDRQRLVLLSIVFGAALALVCYAQSFSWALPWWEALPWLRAIQAPYRLLGPAGYGVALAAGGALALCARPGRLSWAVAALAVAVLAVAGTAGRAVPIAPDASHAVDVGTAIGRERSQPGNTASTDEFLPRTTGYETWHEGQARGFWLYERLWPEASWLAGRLLVWRGDVAVHGLRGGALWTSARVAAGDGGGVLAFHQLAFPGWRAWVDGRPAAVTPAPEVPQQAIRPGFALVQVPPGDHEVVLRFGPDGVHLAAAAASALALLGVALWPLVRQRRGGEGGKGGESSRPAGRAGQGHVSRDRATGATPARAWGRPGPAGLWGTTALAALLFAAGCTLLPLRPGRLVTPATAAVVVDVADEVLAGRAARQSATGELVGPQQMLDVRSLTVQAQDRPLHDAGPRTRRWLFMHAPAEVGVDVTLPPGALFQSALAIDPAAWDAPQGDGVRFVVAVRPEGEGESVVLDATLQPRARGEQRRWVDVAADLGPWAGRRVRLILRTDPRQDTAYDWSGWAEPVVVRVDALTADRLLRSTAETARQALHP
jgi:hypothetical protein